MNVAKVQSSARYQSQDASSNSLYLANFSGVSLAKATPQQLSLDFCAFMATRAWCEKNKVNYRDSFIGKLAEFKRLFNAYGVAPSYIKSRELVFFPPEEDLMRRGDEFAVAEPKQSHHQLFKNYNELEPKDIGERHKSFALIADDSLEKMFMDVNEPPDDLIHVTCSGYLAPSPVERMVERRGWLSTTVTHSYHMGCYGAFPAIRMAHGFLMSAFFSLGQPKNRVDIAHTEIFSAHAETHNPSPEGIIKMTLFSDGFIRYSVVTENYLKASGNFGLKIISYQEQLVGGTVTDMVVVPGPYAFQLGLSPMVPVRIKKAIKEFVVKLLVSAGIDFEVAREHFVFAIHPGGPKIVEYVQSELGLRDEQVARSKLILLEKGNMSSASIPYILKELIEDPAVSIGQHIVALGFGPGLTIAGIILQKTKFPHQ